MVLLVSIAMITLAVAVAQILKKIREWQEWQNKKIDDFKKIDNDLKTYINEQREKKEKG